MIQNIEFGGVSTVPDDYSQADGELSLSMNMVKDAGGLESIGKPQQILHLDEGGRVIYVHKNAGYEHLVIQAGDALSYWDRSSGEMCTMLDALYGWRPSSPHYGWQREYTAYYEWQGGKTVLHGCMSRLFGWQASGEMLKWQAVIRGMLRYHSVERYINLSLPYDPEGGEDSDKTNLWVPDNPSVGSPVYSYDSDEGFSIVGNISEVDPDSGRIGIAGSSQAYYANAIDPDSAKGKTIKAHEYVYLDSVKMEQSVYYIYDENGVLQSEFNGFMTDDVFTGGTEQVLMMQYDDVFIRLSDKVEMTNLTYLYTDGLAYDGMPVYDSGRNLMDYDVTGCDVDKSGTPFFVADGKTYYKTDDKESWVRIVYTGVEAPSRGSRLYDSDGRFTGQTVMSITNNVLRLGGERYYRHSELDDVGMVLYVDEEAPVQGDVMYDGDGQETGLTVSSFTDDGFLDSDGRLWQMASAEDVTYSVTVYTTSKTPSHGDAVYKREDGEYIEDSEVSSVYDGTLWTTRGETCLSTGNDVRVTDTVYTTDDAAAEGDIVYKKVDGEYVASGHVIDDVDGDDIVLDNGTAYRRSMQDDEYTGPSYYTKTDSDALAQGETLYDVEGQATDAVVTEGNVVNGIPYRKYAKDNKSLLAGEQISLVSGIGNILIIVTDKHTHYCLWKTADHDTPKSYYHYLGNKLPTAETDFTNRYLFDADGHFMQDAGRGGGGFMRGSTLKWNAAEMVSGPMEVQRYIALPTSGNPISEISDTDERGQEKKMKLTNLVLGKVNKLLAEATSQGLFVLPRLLRVGLKLYDDAGYVGYSEPFLVCSHDVCSGVWGTDAHQYARIIPFVERYFIRNVEELRQWRDIIKEIVIFASEPIYDYDQSGSVDEVQWDNGLIRVKLPEINMADQVRKLENTFNFYKIYSIDLEKYHSSYSVLRLTKTIYNKDDSQGTITFSLQYYDKTGDRQSVLIDYAVTKGKRISSITADLRKKFSEYGISVYRTVDEKTYYEDHIYDFMSEICLINDYGDVRLNVVSISVKSSCFNVEAYHAYGGILIPELIPLGSLSQQSSISDDYFSHTELLPKVMYQYNGRMNYANVKRKVYRPVLTRHYDAPYWQGRHVEVEALFFYLTIGNRDVIVKSSAHHFFDFSYIYYPDKRCYRCIAKTVTSGGDIVYYSFPMSANDFLNGATWADILPVESILGSHYDDYRQPMLYDPSRYIDTGMTEDPSETEDLWEVLPRTVINSEVRNPFCWKSAGYNDVGNDEIYALSSATVAMSQGQFGQYPVYAFCGDGIYSLDISKEGFYTSISSTTRDVAYRGSIQQTDDAVVFACERGLMMLSGKRAILLSSRLEGGVLNLLSLAGWTQIREKTGCPDIVDFGKYLESCRIAYDYSRQRLYVINGGYDFAWVYSLRSQEWGMCESALSYPLNSYPECLVMNRDNTVVDMGKEEEGTRTGVIVTRPLKLGSPDVLKTVRSVFARGVFYNGDVEMVLYGSRHLLYWYRIWSSSSHYLRGMSGTGYKYFRIVIMFRQGKGESLFGCSVDFTPRQTNQLR